MALEKLRLRVLLTSVEVGIRLCADLRIQRLLLNFDLFVFQLRFAFRLGDLRIDGSRLNGALLFLLLDGIRGIGFGLLRILLNLEFSFADGEVIQLLSDLHFGLDFGIVRRLGRLRLSDSHVTLRLSFGDGSILLDFAHIVLTEGVD